MQVPNWQKHSKKEQKRTLKPRKLQQRKEARRQLINRLLKTSDSRRGFYNMETDKEINDRKHWRQRHSREITRYRRSRDRAQELRDC